MHLKSHAFTCNSIYTITGLSLRPWRLTVLQHLLTLCRSISL